jgi:hypothetical protein
MAIEALMVGARVLLPPNVPEFEVECSDWICASEATMLATQLERLLGGPPPHYRYDLCVHHPDRVMPRYHDLLNHLLLDHARPGLHEGEASLNGAAVVAPQVLAVTPTIASSTPRSIGGALGKEQQRSSPDVTKSAKSRARLPL